eukprot:TRINITY_DN121285_c0_g1_i1.p1 TRINITY_DN121285_c0_g1~~TRINITY_DN121285_c0_g1_i1.p1  ORF type:complete len:392 (+),score=101.38 TRINITY_DN121285_c0_g1_i1:96-1271(+)
MANSQQGGPQAAAGGRSLSWEGYGLVCLLGLLYIGNSAGLIAFNKYLIHEDRFPFAVALVLLHTFFCSCCAGFLYFAMPSWFPSLTDPAQRVAIDRDLILKGALPVAVLFAGQLVLSNTAYLHCSVSFLQMMKEGNLVLVYALSLAVALEKFSWQHVRILGFIGLATALTIHGELNFSYSGFALQGISQLFECTKLVLQSMLLSSAGRKLDALSYVLLVMPLCFLTLSCFLGILIFVHPSSHFQTPTLADIHEWWPFLAANAVVAFSLNVVIALFVKYSSAVAFILCGIVKDAAIVLVGCAFLSEVISGLQAFGFLLQLGGITVWSLAKKFPDRFKYGELNGLYMVAFDVKAPPAPLSEKENEKDYGSVETGNAAEGRPQSNAIKNEGAAY